MSVITISRQFGAGGKTLTQKVAEKIGYQIAHEEIIEQMASMANVSTKGIQAFETEADGFIDKNTGMLAPKRFMDHIFDPGKKYMDGSQYIQLLHAIIPAIADRGNVIILGRGAQFILKGRQDTHHILMIADTKDCIAFMQKNYNLSASDAERAVAKQSKRRVKLMKLFHHESYDAAWNYDLVINMSKIDMDSAVDLVSELATGPSA
ncbi:MAG: cytidylate kinase-like family protein [Deltaproteobacteria bacterium]|nr:cytidylate kinase-like family protein [Deltaproteobacteria bacterium]